MFPSPPAATSQILVFRRLSSLCSVVLAYYYYYYFQFWFWGAPLPFSSIYSHSSGSGSCVGATDPPFSCFAATTSTSFAILYGTYMGLILTHLITHYSLYLGSWPSLSCHHQNWSQFTGPQQKIQLADPHRLLYSDFSPMLIASVQLTIILVHLESNFWIKIL